jgi:hypothetical protein
MRAGMAFAVTGHGCRFRKKTFGRATFADLVGWVERNETHQVGRGLHSTVGFAALNPPYDNTARGPDKYPHVRVA